MFGRVGHSYTIGGGGVNKCLLDFMGLDRALTPAERKRIAPKRKEPTPSGHYLPPGTGPEGETCGSCAHLVRKQLAGTYLKCGLNRDRWTGGGKTDVRARDAACKAWASAETIRAEGAAFQTM